MSEAFSVSVPVPPTTWSVLAWSVLHSEDAETREESARQLARLVLGDGDAPLGKETDS